MFTRRNWLLRCSILINIAVLLYICSHLMIGNSNISLGPAYVIQEDYAVKSQQQQQTASAAALSRPNIVAVAAAAAEAAAAMANINVPQQQLIGDTVMVIHDRQHQPQDSPQETDPEPIVDNEMNQVKICSVFCFFF